MKKILLFFAVLLSVIIIGCSPDSNVTFSDTVQTLPPASGEGEVAITFSKASTSKAFGTDLAYGAALPAPTNIRVVIRRYNGSDLLFDTLGDVEVPTNTTLVINVPAAEGYMIDAFSYVDSTQTYKYLLKHDRVTGQTVVADSVTTVNLTLNPITPQFTIPDTVEQGNEFSVRMDLGEFGEGPNPLQYIAELSMDSFYSDALNANLSGAQSPTSYTGFDYSFEWTLSESNYENQDMFYRSKIALREESYYKNGENQQSFIFNYPNPFQQETLKTYVKIPDGGIGINIEY